ncbi:hypothetical protein [Pseudobacillus badius]|uniref:hypothetical protein n=1 Tax=Bacillus badius TaxID=1455 RepID=UPI000ABD1300
MSYIGKKTNSRTKWAINPVERVVANKKKYDRKRDRSKFQKVLEKELRKYD